jgi:hypothetical protein
VAVSSHYRLPAKKEANDMTKKQPTDRIRFLERISNGRRNGVRCTAFKQTESGTFCSHLDEKRFQKHYRLSDVKNYERPFVENF